MNKNTIVSSLLAVMVTMTLSTANAEERKGPPRGGKPPAEAFEACADKSSGDSCSFTGKRGDASGSCVTPPQGEETLVCKPEGGRPAK